MTPNEKAFLDMLAWSEGTSRVAGSDRGYNVLVGGKLFTSYADHPRILVDLPKLGIKSSAAGRYQLLAKYFDAYKRLLGLPDFSPASQDAIALRQIREQRADDDVRAGRITDAIAKCRNIWASLPGAGYGQHENSLAALLGQYKAAGGKLIA